MINWLPEPLVLNGNSLQGDYDLLFNCFKKDFIDNPPTINEKPIIYETAPDKHMQEYPCGFTHLITHEDKTAKERFIDYTRATKLPWVRAIIDNYNHKEVSAFRVIQSNPKYGLVNNLYLWLEDENFVVIIRTITRSTATHEMLITSYNTTDHTNKKLARLRETRGTLIS